MIEDLHEFGEFLDGKFRLVVRMSPKAFDHFLVVKNSNSKWCLQGIISSTNSKNALEKINEEYALGPSCGKVALKVENLYSKYLLLYLWADSLTTWTNGSHCENYGPFNPSNPMYSRVPETSLAKVSEVTQISVYKYEWTNVLSPGFRERDGPVFLEGSF